MRRLCDRAYATDTRTYFAELGDGEHLLGGGARLNPVLPQVALQQSFPDNDNVYRANAREVNPTGSTWSITVFAVCGVTS